MDYNIDLILVMVFLTLTMIVGIYCGSGSKTLKDQALGGRNFSTAAIVATIIATWVGGDNFAMYLSETYSKGLYFILTSVAGLGAFLIVGYLYVPRMQRFMGKLTIAQAMGDEYGKYARFITVISGLILTVSLLAMQFKIAAELLTNLTGASAIYTVIASAVIVIIYSSFGGIKSVVYTDILQFIIFGSVVPLIAVIIWHDFEDIGVIFDVINTHENFSFGKLFDMKSDKFWSFITLMLLYLIPGFSPTIFSRISVAKNVNQIKNAFFYAAFGVMAIQLIISWISILLFAKNNALDSNNLFAHILNNYSFTGLRALFVIGILTMIMSSVDSCLNCSSVMVANDILYPAGIINEKTENIAYRIATILIGIGALLLALRFDNLFELFMFGYSFYMPIVTVPFTLAVLGFRTSNGSAIAGMLAGFLAVAVWSQLDTNIDSVIPGLIMNLTFMLGYHYLMRQEGGWYFYGHLTADDIEKAKIAKQQKKKFSMKDFCIRNLPKIESLYVLYGMFVVLAMFFLVYALPNETAKNYAWLVYSVMFSNLMVAISFITRPLWMNFKKLDNYLPYAWMFSLCYTLVFSVSLFVMISGFTQFSVMVFMLSIAILSILSIWQATIFLLPIGIYSSLKLYKMVFTTNIELQIFDITNFETQFMYSSIMLIVVLIGFTKPKQNHVEEVEDKVDDLSDERDKIIADIERLSKERKSIEKHNINLKQGINNLEKDNSHLKTELLEITGKWMESKDAKVKFLQTMQHEMNLPMHALGVATDALEKLQKQKDFEPEDMEGILFCVKDSNDRLQILLGNLLKTSLHHNSQAEFNIKDADIIKTINKAINQYSFSDEMEVNFVHDAKNDLLMIPHDNRQILNVISNLLKDAFRYGSKKKLDLCLEQSDDEIIIRATTPGNRLEKGEKEQIFEMFFQGEWAKKMQKGVGLGLYICKKMIERHGGSMHEECTDEDFVIVITLRK